MKKKVDIQITSGRSVTEFFNRILENFERKFDGFPALPAPSSVTPAVQNPEDDLLDFNPQNIIDAIAGAIQQDIVPCPPSSPDEDCYGSSDCVDVETFSRTTSAGSGWGTSEIIVDGVPLVWTHKAGALSGGFSTHVDGDRGIVGGSSTGSPTFGPIVRLALPTTVVNPLEFLVHFGFGATANAGASLTAQAPMAFADNGTSTEPTGQQVRVTLFTTNLGGGDIELDFEARTFSYGSGTSMVWSIGQIHVVAFETVEVDAWIRVRFDALGTHVKGWLDGQTPPMGWDAEDSAPSAVLNNVFQWRGGNYGFMDELHVVEGLDCPECPQLSPGTTVEGRMILVSGSTYTTPTNSNYITSVWVDGLPAIKDIDYTDIPEGIELSYTPSSDAIIMARYVQL